MEPKYPAQVGNTYPNQTMGDPTSRRNQTRNRLRAQLRKKRESLADQFDFKIYIAFVFKEKVSQHFKLHF